MRPEEPGPTRVPAPPLWARLAGEAVALCIALVLSPHLAGPWLFLWLLAGFLWPELVDLAGAVACGDSFETPWGRFYRERQDREREDEATELTERAEQRRLEAREEDEETTTA